MNYYFNSMGTESTILRTSGVLVGGVFMVGDKGINFL